MGNVTVRRIDDTAQHNARLAAATNRRSLEAELRDLIERTYAPVIDDRTARLRAMSGKEAIAHLVNVANGAGDGVFDGDEEGVFRDVDL